MPIPVVIDIPIVEKPEIEINGFADESAWEQASVIEGFTTFRPKPDQTPKQPTTVRVLNSKTALYLHFVAHESDGGEVYGGFGRRDSRKGDDYVGVLIDPLMTGERGALFIVNPLGVQLDGTLVRGRDSDLVPWGGSWSSWDASWRSAGRLTEHGYEVELAIPWKALRPPAEMTQLGITVFRKVARNAEMSAWPRLDPNVEGTLVQTATASGPGTMPRSLGLSVLPEVTATRTDSGVLSDRVGVGGIAPGITLQAAPSPALQILATVNPDFSQVESDETKIDVNQRYSLQYEEKRPFFLEGQEWFSHPIRDLIYTRSMVTPLYGARATSEQNGFSSAILHVHDQSPSPSVSEEGGWSSEDLDGRTSDSTIGRLQWSSDSGQMMGLTASHKAVRGTELEHVLVGTDGRVRLSRRVTVHGAALGSSTTGTEAPFSPAGMLRTRIRSRHLQGRIDATYLSKGFRSENGFQPVADAITLENNTEIVTYPTWTHIPRFLISPTDGEIMFRENGTLREYEYSPSIGSWFTNGTYFKIQAGPSGEEYEDVWLHYTGASLMGGGSWTRWLRARMRLKAGEAPLYDSENPSVGHRYAASTSMTIQPIERLAISPTASWERFLKNDAVEYEGLVTRLKVEVFATPTLWNRWIVDRSTFSGTNSIEGLIAWEHSPGKAAYLGGRYAEGGLDSSGEIDPHMDPSWALFAKLAWLVEG